jgi:hypothetical protein
MAIGILLHLIHFPMFHQLILFLTYSDFKWLKKTII